MTREELFDEVARLLRAQRWAALATRSGDEVLASMVAYAITSRPAGVLLHLSHLAAHTGNLIAHPRASLAVSQSDSGEGDPQQLARITVSGPVQIIGRDELDFPELKARYLERLPDSAQLFDFPDFVLFRLTVEEARFVGGFARAHTLRAADLEAALA